MMAMSSMCRWNRWLMAWVLLVAAPGNAFAQLDVPGLVRSFRHADRLTHPELFARRRLEREIPQADSAILAAAVPALVAALGDSDPVLRTGAAGVLALLGPEARQAAPVLTDMLRDSFGPARIAAAVALARIGPPEVVVRLLSPLLSESGDVPIRVAMILESMGPDAVDAVPALASALAVEGLRWSAARALTAIGAAADDALPALRAAWEDETRPHVRLSIFYAIRAVRPGAATGLSGVGVAPPPRRFSLDGIRSEQRRSKDSTINANIDLLGHADPDVRERAVGAIAWFLGDSEHDRRAPVIAQALAAVAPDESPGVRAAIVRGLGRARRAGGDAVAITLTWSLRDPDADVRRLAAYELAHQGPSSDLALPELVAAAREEQDPRMRSAVISSIAQIVGGSRIQPREVQPSHRDLVLPSLTAAVQDPDSVVRNEAVRAVFAVDRDVGLEVLAEAAEDPDATLRTIAVRTLGGFDPESVPEAIPILDRAFEDESAAVRAIAVRAVGSAHARWRGKPPPDRGSVAMVIERLRDDDAVVRRAAADALGDFGGAAEPAIPALTEALRDPDPDTRWRAASALGDIGPSSAPAVPVLVETLRDEHAGVRRAAAGALGDIGPAAAQAVPALVELLEDQEDVVRESAASALGEIGSAAAAAESTLRSLARRDPVARVRDAAVQALSKILR